MKKNDVKQLHDLTVKELAQKVEEGNTEFNKARSEHAAGKLKNTTSLRTLKKNIAQIKTIMREKELLAKVGATQA